VRIVDGVILARVLLVRALGLWHAGVLRAGAFDSVISVAVIGALAMWRLITGEYPYY
jgi:hypothetical protein